MREIKFRGKRLDNGDWIYGNYVKTYRGIFIGEYNDEIEVDKETVGRLLFECNGKTFWEGDILGGIYEGSQLRWCNECKSEQVYYAAHGCMQCEGDIHWLDVIESAKDGELIVAGNIHDNKELSL